MTTTRQEHEAATAEAVITHLDWLELQAAKQEFVAKGSRLGPEWAALASDVRVIVETAREALEAGEPAADVKSQLVVLCERVADRQRHLFSEEMTSL